MVPLDAVVDAAAVEEERLWRYQFYSENISILSSHK
jgi:hypothetical protein